MLPLPSGCTWEDIAYESLYSLAVRLMSVSKRLSGSQTPLEACSSVLYHLLFNCNRSHSPSKFFLRDNIILLLIALQHQFHIFVIRISDSGVVTYDHKLNLKPGWIEWLNIEIGYQLSDNEKLLLLPYLIDTWKWDSGACTWVSSRTAWNCRLQLFQGRWRLSSFQVAHLLGWYRVKDAISWEQSTKQSSLDQTQKNFQTHWLYLFEPYVKALVKAQWFLSVFESFLPLHGILILSLWQEDWRKRVLLMQLQSQKKWLCLGSH